MLTEHEQRILAQAGSAKDLTARRQAIAIYLAAAGQDRHVAGTLLVSGFAEAVSPSFHLVARGDLMLTEDGFAEAYRALAEATLGFRSISEEVLTEAIVAHPSALVPLRMLVSLTRKELAYAAKLVGLESAVSEHVLWQWEQSVRPLRSEDRGRVRQVAQAVLAMMDGRILNVPPPAQSTFRSKLDHPDTRDGWGGIARSAFDGVPYWVLLYQRYVGGSWRQVQDTYSEVKGDALLEVPLSEWLRTHGIPYGRAARGATGARAMAERLQLAPGPDFVLPDESPTAVIEAKVGEDGGTVRDKAARIKALANTARSRGLSVIALVDGRGWRERPSALLDVVVATEGRTYSLATLNFLEGVPEIRALMGTVGDDTTDR